MLQPSVTPFRQRSWSPALVSAAAHLLMLAAAAGLSQRGTQAGAEEQPDGPPRETRRIEMIYIPPSEPSPPPPAVPRPAPSPPPPVRRAAPEPEPNAPPEAKPSRGVEAETESEEVGASAAEAAIEPVAPTAGKAAATMESEARRIFGRPRLATRAGAGPRAVRPMEAWLPDRTERCIPREGEPVDSAGPAQLGTVVGRIFRQDNGRPLAGAHLHMIGTPYVTFTDGSGEYRFHFDLALVENCRTQYVKVTADGYESRLLVLVVGPQVQSEDVRLRRR